MEADLRPPEGRIPRRVVDPAPEACVFPDPGKVSRCVSVTVGQHLCDVLPVLCEGTNVHVVLPRYRFPTSYLPKQ
eukprot:2485677-Rhodomonas_salina.3